MATLTEVQRRLASLQARLDAVNRAWTMGNYEELLAFYVDVLPQILESERATIFIVEPGSQTIWSKIGTGIREREIEAPREDSVVGRAVSTGSWVIENALSPDEGFHAVTDAQTGFVTRNLLCAPIRSLVGYGVTGAIQVLNRTGGQDYTESDARRLQQVADYLAMAIENILVNKEILTVSQSLNRQVEELRSSYLGEVPLVAESQAMRGVMDMVRMVSGTPVNVLIQGENGTGKEVIARLVHDASERRDGPFVAVNCAAIPENLMESEFFGYEKGAFTGAVGSRPGRFEEATGGTFFLDEVADLPLSLQPKFLRVLQEEEGSRLGSGKVRPYDFRLISASNRDLKRAVQEGRFREDLYYRLFALQIDIPPLRQRPDDVAPLVHAFLADVCKRFGKTVAGFSPEVMALFERHPWPGNVRQLRREVERVVALAPPGGRISADLCSEDLRRGDPGKGGQPEGGLDLPSQVDALERELITRAMAASRGNKARAAELLGITRQGLHKKLKRLDAEAGAG